MKVIAITNHKGGTGKTTTAINLGVALEQSGSRVLLVDADPQANLTQSLGIGDDPQPNLYSIMKKEMDGDDAEIRQAIIRTDSGVDVVPASLELAGAELELVSVFERERVISNLLQPVLADYDFIFIDCPHAIGMITVNALVASDFVLIPLQGEYLPMKGVDSFMRQFALIRKKLNKKLELLGLLLTKYDDRKTMNHQVREKLLHEYDEKLFRTVIRSNIQLAKAQEAGRDIFSFDSRSNGAIDYRLAAGEFLEKIVT